MTPQEVAILNLRLLREFNLGAATKGVCDTINSFLHSILLLTHHILPTWFSLVSLDLETINFNEPLIKSEMRHKLS